jgi:hypothetical protein
MIEALAGGGVGPLSVLTDPVSRTDAGAPAGRHVCRAGSADRVDEMPGGECDERVPVAHLPVQFHNSVPVAVDAALI